MPELPFETAMEKLETILEAIEAPDVTLDASLALYKVGIELAKDCGEILARAEADVLQLQQSAEDVFSTAPFAEGS